MAKAANAGQKLLSLVSLTGCKLSLPLKHSTWIGKTALLVGVWRRMMRLRNVLVLMTSSRSMEKARCVLRKSAIRPLSANAFSTLLYCARMRKKFIRWSTEMAVKGRSTPSDLKSAGSPEIRSMISPKEQKAHVCFTLLSTITMSKVPQMRWSCTSNQCLACVALLAYLALASWL